MTVPAEAIAAVQDAIPLTWVDDHWQPVLSRREIRKLLDAAAPFLAEDGWDAARDRATEANDARRDERERCAQLCDSEAAGADLMAPSDETRTISAVMRWTARRLRERADL